MDGSTALTVAVVVMIVVVCAGMILGAGMSTLRPIRERERSER